MAISFWSERSDIETRSVAQQKEKVKSTIAELGWECPRILENLDFDPDFYFGPLGQVKARTWSQGRFGLVGDAAHCPSPLTGMGTSLAIVGAYFLAGVLAKEHDFTIAFRSYEKIFRPYVERAQKLPPGTPRLAFPQSQLGVTLFNTATSIFSSRIIQRGLSFFDGFRSSKDDLFLLPTYSEYEA